MLESDGEMRKRLEIAPDCRQQNIYGGVIAPYAFIFNTNMYDIGGGVSTTQPTGTSIQHTDGFVVFPKDGLSQDLHDKIGNTGWKAH